MQQAQLTIYLHQPLLQDTITCSLATKTPVGTFGSLVTIFT